MVYSPRSPFIIPRLLVLGLWFVLPGSESLADTLDAGLIAYYPLDGNATDASGNGHHGTVFGATSIGGRIGGAFHFDGNESIDVPDSPAFSLGSGPFTMALWLKLDVVTGNYYAMGHDEGPGQPNSKWIFWVNPGASRFFLHVHSRTIDFNVLSPSTWVADTQWHHLAITRDATLFSFYLDGELLGVDTNAGAIPDPNTPFQMGTAESGHPERVLRGALDDVRLYNRALSASELKQLAEPSSTCISTQTAPCLNKARFRVGIEWRDFQGKRGPGRAAPSDLGDSSNIWFFSPNNWEVLIKVLDGCSINNRYWVFFAATTTVEFTVTVTDTQEGGVASYFNPLGNPADAVTDTSAFATCP